MQGVKNFYKIFQERYRFTDIHRLWILYSSIFVLGLVAHGVHLVLKLQLYQRMMVRSSRLVVISSSSFGRTSVRYSDDAGSIPSLTSKSLKQLKF